VVAKRKLGVDKRVRLMLLEQLHHEISVLKKLNHPNVIPLVDVFETPDKVFIVMELMKGGELFDCIVRKGRFSEREAIDVVAQVASGLAHCHEQGVVHRDLKPENLLLEEKWEPWHDKNKKKNGSMGVVKIADFGFSRSLGTATTRSYIGTAGYLAPELRQGKAYSKSVDVWALGVIMYVLLSGHLPFPPEAHPILEQDNMVKRFALKFHKAQWSTISMSAKELIWAMLQVDPDERCTARDVCQHPWVKGKPLVSDAPLATVEKLRKRAEQRNKALPRFHSFFVEPHQQSKSDGKVKIILPSPPTNPIKREPSGGRVSPLKLPSEKPPRHQNLGGGVLPKRTTMQRQKIRDLQLQEQRKIMANHVRDSLGQKPSKPAKPVADRSIIPGSPERRLTTRNPARLEKGSKSDEVHLNLRRTESANEESMRKGSRSIPMLRHSQSQGANGKLNEAPVRERDDTNAVPAPDSFDDDAGARLWKGERRCDGDGVRAERFVESSGLQVGSFSHAVLLLFVQTYSLSHAGFHAQRRSRALSSFSESAQSQQGLPKSLMPVTRRGREERSRAREREGARASESERERDAGR
jgi:serine/threonine protein kinase